MNLKEIGEIPYIQKKPFMEEVGLLYKKIKGGTLILTENHHAYKLNDSRANLAISLKSISIFETILNLLTNDQRLVLEKDYIYKAESDWFKNHWAKSTYYKIKHEAIDQFLFLFFT